MFPLNLTNNNLFLPNVLLYYIIFYSTIQRTAELICSNEKFSTLCKAFGDTGLGRILNEKDGTDGWTLFAPTNDAFNALSDDMARDIFTSEENAKFVLLNHVVEDLELTSEDLQCTWLLPMANDKDTRTVCINDKAFQNGGGNSDNKRPEIVGADYQACNGIVHIVNEVILPTKLPDKNQPKPAQEPTLKPASKPTLKPTSKPTSKQQTSKPTSKPTQKQEPILMNAVYYTASTTPLGDSTVRSDTTIFVPQWVGLDSAPNDVVCFVGGAGNLEPGIRSQFGGGGTNCTATNGCGVHVHAGTDCSNTETQGGHWYNTEVLSIDPWAIIGYKQTDSDGYGQYASCVRTGFDVMSDPSQLMGRAFIVHAEDGSRISCGLITELPRDFEPITFTAETAPIPGTEDYSATGSVSVMANVQDFVNDGVCYMGYAKGLEPDVESFLLGTGSQQCNATNGCGAHIHDGFGCENTDAQGGHYYDDTELAEDPWQLESYYTTDSSGEAALIGCAITGYGASQYDSRAFIVHKTDGSRLLCGLLEG